MSENLRVSKMAESLIGSEIIKLAGEIREKMNKGEQIYNFTIGDFDPKIFPIPQQLKNFVTEAYNQSETNYPPAEGLPELRKEIIAFSEKNQGLKWADNEVLVAGGARPVIYAIFQCLVDAGDTVVFPVPSWNNNHYTHLSHAKQVFLETHAENNFMPTAAELAPHLNDATLLALCSPLNPSGTVFGLEQLTEICDLVLKINQNKKEGEKPLYLMYDQIYWPLTFGDVKHYDPISIRPEIKKYCVYVDGISKSLAATGVRVGWAYGAAHIISRMKSILGHIGAWAPRPEQKAVANYLNHPDFFNFLKNFKTEVNHRLSGLHQAFQQLKKEGFLVDSIQPMAAIYLTVQFNLKGKKTADGKTLNNTKDVTAYLLDEAKFAIVPFYAFGASNESDWFRVSVGTMKKDDSENIYLALKNALSKLS